MIRSRCLGWTLPLAATLLFGGAVASAQPVDYDIVYVRQPRYGDTTNTIWPEVGHPARAEPGADLMLLHPDGSEEVLVRGGNGSVTDPAVSFDAEWVYYAYFYDLTSGALNRQQDNLPLRGADIFRINLQTREIQQLTHGEFTPNTASGRWDESNPVDPARGFNRLGYGILNLAPCPLPGGKLAFTSNRNGFQPTKTFTHPTMQLFVMDEDGSNVTQIAPMNIGSALHPTVLEDGRILFSTYESQGLRDKRLWGIWAIWPDGRHWEPVVSAFHEPKSFHFMTQMGNGDIVVEDYYNHNDNGFGALYRFPVKPPAGAPGFHSAFLADNPPIEVSNQSRLRPFRMAFTPWGLYSITPFANPDDQASPKGSTGDRTGKLTHPSAAPHGDLLVVWTPGPANNLKRPTNVPYYDGGLYLMPGGDVVDDPFTGLVEIKNDPAYNEAWPRAVVPYSAIHGIAEPAELPWLPNDGTVHAALPAGTPYGLIGTSSFYKRESGPGVGSSKFDGLDPFNTSQNNASSNWLWQGADAGRYTNSDIWAVRIVAMEPNSDRAYGPDSGSEMVNAADERLRILGEIPLRKVDASGRPVIDPEGNPDTSFLAKIPADTPFTFQTLDRNGMVLNMAQTWHQLRPGEIRADCGGCHAHSQQPLAFAGTAASQPDYPIFDLSKVTPLVSRGAGGPTLEVSHTPSTTVEFLRDIRPILQRSCVPCHAGTNAPGKLQLDDLALYNGVPGDYARLADDTRARWGYPPVIKNRQWRQTNASRYVRMFQSRRSLLVWKVFGERLDGWTNADHPTEAVPGDPSTLPSGAKANDADLDFDGVPCPPPGSGVPPLTEDEKLTIARWIDLGAPIDRGPKGWFLDNLRPTLTVSEPRAGANADAVTEIRFGLADADSGIDAATLHVSADFPVAGRAAGTELADLAQETGDGIYAIQLGGALPALGRAHLHVEVADRQGNVTRVDRTFSTSAP